MTSKVLLLLPIALLLCCCSSNKVNDCEIFLDKNHFLVEESIFAECMDDSTLVLQRKFSPIHEYIFNIQDSSFKLNYIYSRYNRLGKRLTSWEELKNVGVGKRDFDSLDSLFFTDFKSFICFLENKTPSQFDSAYAADTTYYNVFGAPFSTISRLEWHYFHEHQIAKKNSTQLYYYSSELFRQGLSIHSIKTDSAHKDIFSIALTYKDSFDSCKHIDKITENSDSTIKVPFTNCAEIVYHEPTDSIEVALSDSALVSYTLRQYKSNGDTTIRYYSQYFKNDTNITTHE